MELCNQYYAAEEETEGEIVECPGPTLVLTMLHKRFDESTDVLGTVGSQELVEAGGAQVDYSFIFPEEPMIPAEMVDGLIPEELEQSHPQPTAPEEIPAFTWEFDQGFFGCEW